MFEGKTRNWAKHGLQTSAAALFFTLQPEKKAVKYKMKKWKSDMDFRFVYIMRLTVN